MVSIILSRIFRKKKIKEKEGTEDEKRIQKSGGVGVKHGAGAYDAGRV